MNCIICRKPVVLAPSATERARRYGGVPADYTEIFTAHADCTIRQRNEQVSDLIKRKGNPDQ